MAHRPRFMPEEKLPNQRVNLLSMDLPIMNRGRGGKGRALGVLSNLSLADRSHARPLSGARGFGKKLTESDHWTTALRRPIREIESTAGAGAGSQASTGTSSRL